MSGQIRVFVSSTFKDLRREREYLAIVLERMNLHVKLFPEEAGPGTGQNDYLKYLDKCHLMIAVLTGDSSAVQLELDKAERIGIPVLELAPLLDMSGGTLGLGPMAQQQRSRKARFQRKFSTLKELGEAVTETISEILLDRFESTQEFKPFTSDIYRALESDLGSASRQHALAQQTSSLVLGAKKDRKPYESPYLDKLRKTAGNNGVRFLHIFSWEATLEAVKSGEYPDAGSSIRWLAGQKIGDDFKVCPIRGDVTAVVVNDSLVQVGTRLGTERFLIDANQAGSLARSIWDKLETYAAEYSTQLPIFLAECETRL
jgi:Domain of unknown function (DUF4062)